MPTPLPLRVRWLGRVRYRDAAALQVALVRSPHDYLLLLEHDHVLTLGSSAKSGNILVDPSSWGADVESADRGGDVTYHGPGQLTGYPLLTLPEFRPGLADVVAHVRSMEELVIQTCRRLGLANVGRLSEYPGVWVDPKSAAPRKIAAVGTRVSRLRTKHGFALNVSPDLSAFERIVPCGISKFGVTSLHAEGLEVSMSQVVGVMTELAPSLLGHANADSGESRPADFAGLPFVTLAADLSAFSREAFEARGSAERRSRRIALAESSPALGFREKKPPWMRVKLDLTRSAATRAVVRGSRLVTVCEEAGCPNLSECWADGTATFMINGERCTRACGFCLVDTSRPMALDADEPERVAGAVAELGLNHAVITCVARDDLRDGGAGAFAQTIDAIRSRRPECRVEVLISDLRGDPASLAKVFDARPDVLNHNLETVLRLQSVVRPQASYARSLAVLSRAAEAGLITKSGLMVGLGESHDEMLQALSDLRAVGVSILTVGQYLRPSERHLAISRFWHPEEFDALAFAAREMGFAHVECGPLVRSSYHARDAGRALLAPASA